VRLSKWYSQYSGKERTKLMKTVSAAVLARGPKLCNFLEMGDVKVVYKRYASLYFCMAVDPHDNELSTLEVIHQYVEILDRCETGARNPKRWGDIGYSE